MGVLGLHTPPSYPWRGFPGQEQEISQVSLPKLLQLLPPQLPDVAGQTAAQKATYKLQEPPLLMHSVPSSFYTIVFWVGYTFHSVKHLFKTTFQKFLTH